MIKTALCPRNAGHHNLTFARLHRRDIGVTMYRFLPPHSVKSPDETRVEGREEESGHTLIDYSSITADLRANDLRCRKCVSCHAYPSAPSASA